MNVLKISRGRDIDIEADGEMLFGVIDFSSEEKSEHDEIRTYLSGEPAANVSVRKEYRIILKALSLFDASGVEKENFTLTVKDGAAMYVYTQCRTVKRSRSAKPEKYITDTYEIIAGGFEKKEITA